MLISSIVAISKNRVIGKEGKLPWYLPNDLKYFKKMTLNKPVIMGRKTFDSIGNILPKRTNIIMSRDPFFVASNCLIANDLDTALEMAFDTGAEECFIIGGGEIFKEALPQCDHVYLTEVEIDIEGGDAFFPALDDEWIKTKETFCPKDEKNEYNHWFKIYARK